MIKSLAFDIGQVICHVDFDRLETLARVKYGVGNNDFYRWLDEVSIQVDLGIWTIEQACQYLGSGEVDLDKVAREWFSCMKMSEQMMDTLSNLADMHFDIYLLSNIGHQHRDLIVNENRAFFRSCRGFVASCDAQVRKPQKAFFEYTIRRYPELKGSLYFDDREENCEAAKGYLRPIRFHLTDFKDDDEAARKIYEYVLRDQTLSEIPPPSTS